MIEPILGGAALLDEIETLAVPQERVALWWLGQSGFALKWGDAIIFIDPYLSEHLTAKYASTARPHVRMTAAPFRGTDVRRLDLLLATHKHSDHLDPGAMPDLLRNCAGARLAVPRALVDHATAMGVDRARIIAADADQEIRYPIRDREAIVHPIPSAHEQLDYSPSDGYPYLGYILQLGRRTIYHSGDCVLYDGLAERLQRFRLDLALLPINGRDPARGVPGNFTMAEAAQVAADANAQWLVPMHYDMFTFNTVGIGDFVTHMRVRHPQQQYRVLRCGERWLL